jgi:hypothetical protein
MAERSFVAGPEAEQGKKLSLPTGRLLTVVFVSSAVVSVVSWWLAGWLRPAATAESWIGGGLSGVSLAATMLVFMRPWKPRTLGIWSFAMLHMSMLSMGPVLLGIVLIYSSSGMDAVVLGLTAAGAWLTGFLATVFVFGRVAKATESTPDQSPDKA